MKNNKKDYQYISICIITFIIFLLCQNKSSILLCNNNLYNQISIIDHLRTLFNNTHSIFNFYSYTLNTNLFDYSQFIFYPITLISYFIPYISTYSYIKIISILFIFINTISIYYFVKKDKYSSEISFLVTIIYILSTCFTFNYHNDIFYITYLPILLLSFYAVDKKMETKKSFLLIISTFLLAISNYKLLFSSIVSIIIYTIYKNLKKSKKLNIKIFTINISGILLPLLIGITCASFYIIPSLINDFIDRANYISLLDLIKRDLTSSLNVFYGLGVIAYLPLVLFTNKNRENIFLTIALIICTLLPSSIYILNLLTEVNYVVIMSFIPLFIIVITETINNIFNHNINYKKIIIPIIIVSIILLILSNQLIISLLTIIILYLIIFIHEKTNDKRIILYVIPILLFITSLYFNNNDTYVLKSIIEEENEIKEVIDKITDNDKEFYSINNQVSNNFNTYQNNYYFKNDSKDIYELIQNNSKYIISRNKAPFGYKEIDVINGIHVYKNENTKPFGYVTNKLTNYVEYEKLNESEEKEVSTNYVITKNKKTNLKTNTLEININYNKIFNNKNIKIENNKIKVKTKETIKLTYELPTRYQKRIINIGFDIKGKNKTIIINGQKNKSNYTEDRLNYSLSTNETNLTFILYPGEYELSNFKTYILDYSNIIDNEIDPFIVSRDNVKGNNITGLINVKNGGYFISNLSYDDKFDIKVDGKKVKYELVNNHQIGFEIKKGYHLISITYKPLFKELSEIITGIGMISCILVIHIENKRIIK